MAIDTSIPRTRRALLAGGIGGAAALVASAVGRPVPASAADGEALLLGRSNEATSPTSLAITGVSMQMAFRVSTNEFGATSIEASSEKGAGISAYGANCGVAAHSTKGPAIRGDNIAMGPIGVWGASPNQGVVGYSTVKTGVQGFSGGEWDPPPTSPAQTGVHGYAIVGKAPVGVHGQSTAGRGIYGQATSGTGVYATATTGYALRAVGRVKLDKCAGVATIAATKSSVVVTPGIDLVSTSAVVATLQGNAGGNTTVKRVAVNTTANTFTIYLTANSTANVKVAWHVFG